MKRRIDDGLEYHAWFESNVSITNRIIILTSPSEGDEIDITSSLHFIKCMTFLESISNDPIVIVINSPGGCIFSSFAIYDRIKESKCKTIIRGYGSIMSGASIIMQAADVRTMTENSVFMIHDGSIMFDNDMNKAKKWMQAYDNLSSTMYDIYFNNMKKKNKKLTKNDVIKMCKDETILNAEESVKLGLIDTIYKG